MNAMKKCLHIFEDLKNFLMNIVWLLLEYISYIKIVLHIIVWLNLRTHDMVGEYMIW